MRTSTVRDISSKFPVFYVSRDFRYWPGHRLVLGYVELEGAIGLLFALNTDFQRAVSSRKTLFRTPRRMRHEIIDRTELGMSMCVGGGLRVTRRPGAIRRANKCFGRVERMTKSSKKTDVVIGE